MRGEERRVKEGEKARDGMREGRKRKAWSKKREGEKKKKLKLY